MLTWWQQCAEALGHQWSLNRSRTALWLPVMLGIGIGIYFSLHTEPSQTLLYGLLGFALIWAALAFLLRAPLHPHYLARLTLWAIAAICFGFAIAGLRAESRQHVILAEEVGPTMLHGIVERVEDRVSGQRLVVSSVDLWDYAKEKTPAKVRLVVRTKPNDAMPGDKIAVRVKLQPLPRPVLPGGYDFARMAYFQEIGAVGFAVSPVKVLAKQEGAFSAFNLAFEHHRQRVIYRVKQALGMGEKPQAGEAITLALLTGEGGSIPENAIESLRASGLAHILSISGLHMVLVCGVAFVALRMLLALFPPLVLRYSTKKWAAWLALLFGGYYLLLAGMPVPAVRAYFMIALFFLAVITDRTTTAMWPVTLAALLLLTLWPESLLSPSFQMSFAAVIALCAWFGQPPEPEGLDRSWARRLSRNIYDVAVSSLVAGFATAPFALYHFGRFAVYGMLSNVLAMPVTSIIIMPASILSLLLMPFGLESWPLELMRFGCHLLVVISDAVMALPFSTLSLPRMGLAPLVLITLGGLIICLWQGRARWLGSVPILAAFILYAGTTYPNLLLDEDGKLFAIHDEQGRLLVPNRMNARYARESWMQSLGVKQATRFDELPNHDPLYNCTKDHCEWRGFIRSAECLPARLLVLTEEGECANSGQLITKGDLARSGTHAIWLEEEGVKIETVAENRGLRWWTGR